MSPKVPRCISGLSSHAVALRPPTILARNSVFQFPLNGAKTRCFAIGCSCGEPAAFLLGYHVRDEANAEGFVGPLSLRCSNCKAVMEFFDTRMHGHDGEQGCNTYIVGNGTPDAFSCPRCGVAPFSLTVVFDYADSKPFPDERPEDFFTGFSVLGKCTKCDSIVEITSFECA
jgi:hypothetical protein